ncbi:MAG: hypothetical protein KF744_15260 [Taibaiella sp.]|nr:hypothetical protein [Taibaiella sp.]
MRPQVYFLSLVFACLSWNGFSQVDKDLSKDEVTLFFSLITETQEYNQMKHVLDSVNALGDPTMPQELDRKIHKRAGDEENYVAHAYLERRLAIGMTVDRYVYEYDRRTHKIKTVVREKTRFRLEEK